MILKTFFFNLYLLESNVTFSLVLALTAFTYSFITTSLRHKFFFFLLLLFFFSIWGFLYNLDGMILILLITEFTVFLLFLMTYTQLYSNFQFTTKKPLTSIYFLVFYLYIIWGFNSHNFTLSYVSYYNDLTAVIAADFFILYFVLFDKLPLVVLFIVLIIGLFSLFFILIYFNLKIIKYQHHIKLNTVYFLRKQRLVKQTNFKSNLFTFQN